MLIAVQLIIIAILVISLIVLMSEENKLKKSKVPRGIIKEYWDGSERRQTRRINISLIVKYSLEKKYSIKLNGRMKDISCGGMRLLVNEKLSEGAILLLEFNLPEQKSSICAEGKVAWGKGDFTERDKNGRRVFQTGIQFVNIKPDDKNMLTSYIDKNSEKT